MKYSFEKIEAEPDKADKAISRKKRTEKHAKWYNQAKSNCGKFQRSMTGFSTNKLWEKN